MSSSRLAHYQQELALVRARLLAADSFTRSAGSDGTNLTNEARKELEQREAWLASMVDRASGNSPMFARGRVRGLSV